MRGAGVPRLADPLGSNATVVQGAGVGGEGGSLWV